jgi:hypothetical protein
MTGLATGTPPCMPLTPVRDRNRPHASAAQLSLCYIIEVIARAFEYQKHAISLKSYVSVLACANSGVTLTVGLRIVFEEVPLATSITGLCYEALR